MFRSFFTDKLTGWTAAARQGQALHIVQARHEPGGRPSILRASRLDDYADDPAACLARADPTHKLRSTRFNFLLSPDDYQLLQVDTPEVPEAERRTALRWQLKDALNQGVDESVFDVVSLPATASTRGREPSLVVAAARTTLAPIVQTFQRARLPLRAIDVPEMALRNLAILHDSAPRGIALLHIDDGGGLVVMCHEGRLVTSRRFELGANALARDDEQRIGRFERLGLELQRSLDNFDRQYNHIPLSRLLVAVPERAASVIDFLASTLYIPVEALDLNTRLDGWDRLGDCSLLALGAALRAEPA